MKLNAQTFRTIHKNGLELKVYNADENSFGVASTIISGEKDAVLVDAQFTLSDAEKIAQELKQSNKNLTTIYVSHGDPDFYFGLEVFKKYFPQVTVYASASTIEHIKETAQKKLEVWGPILAENGTKNIVLPQVLKGSNIELEGQKLEIIGLEEGFPTNTFIWIPTIKAVLGGINVFGDTFHVWMADSQTHKERQDWIAILEKIKSLNPEIVIPAHASNHASFDIKSINYTQNYILNYEEVIKIAKTSEEVISAMKKKYPNSTFEVALQIGAKVNTGEMKW